MIDIDYVQVVKWILIVLLAGFIGQFGKSLATYLIKKARGAKGEDRSDASTDLRPPEQPKGEAYIPTPVTSERLSLPDKAEKKAAKALIKMKKKEKK